MKNLIDYVPKKYKPYVADFHREYEEGYTYWLSLKCDGKYHLSSYCSEFTIHENSITEVIRVLREHITIK